MSRSLAFLSPCFTATGHAKVIAATCQSRRLLPVSRVWLTGLEIKLAGAMAVATNTRASSCTNPVTSCVRNRRERLLGQSPAENSRHLQSHQGRRVFSESVLCLESQSTSHYENPATHNEQVLCPWKGDLCQLGLVCSVTQVMSMCEQGLVPWCVIRMTLKEMTHMINGFIFVECTCTAGKGRRQTADSANYRTFEHTLKECSPAKPQLPQSCFLALIIQS